MKKDKNDIGLLVIRVLIMLRTLFVNY